MVADERQQLVTTARVRCYDCKPVGQWLYYCEDCAADLMARHRQSQPTHRPELTISHDLPGLQTVISQAAKVVRRYGW